MESSSLYPSYLAPPDERFMREALREAKKAADEDEVPVGCVIVSGGRIMGRAHNQREQLNDPTAHAEMLALTQAAARQGDWRLEGASVYVTLEPCPMCAGAMVLARIARLVFGATDPKAGACGTLYDIPRDSRLNHRIEVLPGILAEPCGAVLKSFFAGRRGRFRASGPGPDPGPREEG